MNLDDVVSFLNFWVNKYLGAYFTPEEICDALDGGQMSYYTDIKGKYATSTEIKQILSPFKRTYEFTPSNTISGYVVVPSNVDYLDFLDMQIEVDISSRILYNPVEIVSEDTRAERLNSQIDPVTVSNPIAEIMADRYFKMYPVSGYRGIITYLKRPTKPVYGFNIISGRVPVYNPATSTQLEWRQTDLQPVMLKALVSLGVNLSALDLQQFAAVKTTDNYNNQNRM